MDLNFRLTSVETLYNQAQSEYRALADISRSALCCHSKRPVHRLQICPTVHN